MPEKQKVLIVDDSPAMRSLLRAFLKDYDVYEANDGRTALGAIAQNQPDLILLDVKMPGVDGKSVLSILKGNQRTANIPVVHITAVKDSCYSLELLAKGADDIITKPCSADMLRARVAYLLKVKNAYDELAKVPHILSSLARQVEERLPFLRGHSVKVEKYAEILGQQLLLPPRDLSNLKIASSLILLGYTCVSDSQLILSDKLSPEAMVAVHRHTALSMDICSGFVQLENIGTWLADHHEWFNGTGYPAGLAGTDISLGGRCLAIAEAYAALTSDRPYRQAFSADEAIHILQQGAGTQWDPDLVASFITGLDKVI